jgi:hypothetical protein
MKDKNNFYPDIFHIITLSSEPGLSFIYGDMEDNIEEMFKSLFAKPVPKPEVKRGRKPKAKRISDETVGMKQA